MMQTADKFIVRLPDGLRDEIKEAAHTNCRSMNSEIVDRLTGGTGGPQALRDKFAIQALPAIIAATSAGQHVPQMLEGETHIRFAMARNAYEMADAMLAARKGGA
jgi:hypothetical protein